MRAVKEVAAESPEQEWGPGGRPPLTPLKRLWSFPGRARQFLHDVRLEMRNVTWPTSKDVQATTMVVVVTTFFFGFFLGMALDVPFSRWMGWLLKHGQELLK